MVTFMQLNKDPRKKKIRTNKNYALSGRPQRKAYCLRIYKAAPKKPNSARRSVARVTVLAIMRSIPSKKATVYIPGEGHQLQKFSCILIRGGRVPDLPGVRYKVIRGKYDCLGVLRRGSSRSRYGVRRIDRLHWYEKKKL
jgi:small subunit ribosomal protein S12